MALLFTDLAFSSILLPLAGIFDRVFGTKHWSAHCFVRSCIASLTASLVALLIWLFRGADWVMLAQANTVNTRGLPITYTFNMKLPASFLFFGVGLTVVVNLIPDYFALLGYQVHVGS